MSPSPQEKNTFSSSPTQFLNIERALKNGTPLDISSLVICVSAFTLPCSFFPTCAFTIKNGPRVIDLDLLFYENETADTPELMLPHPGVKERAFVLYPLHDIFPDMKIFGYDYSESFKNCDGNTVTFYSEL